MSRPPIGWGREAGVSRAHWDERYGTAELIWKADPNRFLVEELEGLAPGRALDIACGEGRNAIWLASMGWEVTGVDFSAVGLAKARRHAAERGLRATWIEADVVGWQPPPAAFDAVVVMYLHLPPEPRRAVLEHASDALAPGGVLLVVGHDLSNLSEGTGGPQDPDVLYAHEDIVSCLPGLSVERAERVTRWVVTETGDAKAFDALVRAVRRA